MMHVAIALFKNEVWHDPFYFVFWKLILLVSCPIALVLDCCLVLDLCAIPLCLRSVILRLYIYKPSI
jgi:hypothetical protein